jgi:hypothetical protein
MVRQPEEMAGLERNRSDEGSGRSLADADAAAVPQPTVQWRSADQFANGEEAAGTPSWMDKPFNHFILREAESAEERKRKRSEASDDRRRATVIAQSPLLGVARALSAAALDREAGRRFR